VQLQLRPPELRRTAGVQPRHVPAGEAVTTEPLEERAGRHGRLVGGGAPAVRPARGLPRRPVEDGWPREPALLAAPVGEGLPREPVGVRREVLEELLELRLGFGRIA